MNPLPGKRWKHNIFLYFECTDNRFLNKGQYQIKKSESIDKSSGFVQSLVMKFTESNYNVTSVRRFVITGWDATEATTEDNFIAEIESYTSFKNCQFRQHLLVSLFGTNRFDRQHTVFSSDDQTKQ